MRYRKLTADGDYSFGHGQLDYFIDTPEGVAQAVKTRLLLLAGEWFLDVTSGTPFSTQILGTNTTPTRDLAIKRRILETEGVQELLSYASQVTDRNFTVQARIQTVYSVTPVEVSFP